MEELDLQEINLVLSLLDQVQFTRKDIAIIEPLYQKLTMKKLALENPKEEKKGETL